MLIKEFGKIFKIKYNPLSPSDYTHRLNPDKGFIVSGIIAFVVFATIGYKVLSMSFRKRRKKTS